MELSLHMGFAPPDSKPKGCLDLGAGFEIVEGYKASHKIFQSKPTNFLLQVGVEGRKQGRKVDVYMRP